MKVSEIIELLNKNYDPDDAVVVAWWDQASFSAAHDMDKDEWADVAEDLDGIDWSYTHDILTDALTDYLEN
jgi:hypothetical protein